MKNQQQMPKILFDKRNLYRDEEVLMTARPDKRSFMIINILTGGKTIPFPFALIWGIIDFGILISCITAAIIGSDGFPAEMLFFLVPFIGVHATPVWIYLYGVTKGAKDYHNCGHIITNQRVLTRSDRKSPFETLNISDISSITMLSNKPRSSSVHIAATSSSLTLKSLILDDAERIMDILHDLKDMEKNKKLNERYRAVCTRCGGRTKEGKCLYCGSAAELKDEFKNLTTQKTRR